MSRLKSGHATKSMISNAPVFVVGIVSAKIRLTQLHGPSKKFALSVLFVNVSFSSLVSDKVKGISERSRIPPAATPSPFPIETSRPL